MAVPAFVGAGSGQLITTGTATVAKTGCTAGNMMILHVLEHGGPSERTIATEVNLNALDGTPGHSSLITGATTGGADTCRHNVYCGRAIANGTVSVVMGVGASGFDLFCRWYEFSGVTTSTSPGDASSAFENSTGTVSDEARTNASIFDSVVTTNGADRLALNFTAVESSVALGPFTAMTGGTWAEAVAEYSEASGQTGTLQLQTASMSSPGTINGGEYAVGGSVNSGCVGTALIPLIDSVTVNVTVNF